MPTLSRSALVMYSVEQMYELVNDVKNYPEFLPDCSDSRLISHEGNEMTASLLVSKGGLKKWFTTKNVLTPNKQVLLHLVDGPFKQLTGTWKFIELSEGACKISLQLEYEFASKVFDLAFGRVFNHLANNMVQAFTLRAKNIYGVNVE
jgi:ribosome-associated toxin RatA of RatAB toxin-antitoxin module